MKKRKILIGGFLITILILALASVVSTFGIWDGVIPSANIKIRIIDNQNLPISGAQLTVFEKHGFIKTNKSISYDFPIQEFKRESQPISNSDGVIEVSHLSEGLEIGGGAFALFWIIPISFGDPKFIIHIKAPDGREQSFEYSDLYINCNEKPTILHREENPVNCEHNIILK